ncbi:hypothetical protein GCK72_025939 [Caenorhabditis remanei]|uniref:Uncharacterized protein n=1 Tax=Caenorhabditis remanei TaxID=31234 RepID=A0A6A5G429_CAERE|nr:hypothetical protein GCK72_025939 [Caenorhabditis remanei]KAF1749471.1 hypothetical protein GCK72_025939 [Caenorhabditis remanei]
MEFFGFACEQNEDKIKIFTLEQGMVELEYEGCDPLGKWFEVSDDEIELHPTYSNKEIEVWEEDGEVFAKVLAVGPNLFCLPKDIRGKYSKVTAWSPLLKYLDDETGTFAGIRGNDVVYVVVKYAPWSNGPSVREQGLFKIQEVFEVEEDRCIAYCRQTPWTLEYMGQTLTQSLKPKPNTIAFNQYQKVDDDGFRIGLCIKSSYPNAGFNQELNPSDGSSKFCSLLFTPDYGIVRYTFPVNKPRMVTRTAEAVYDVDSDLTSINKRIGQWYTFQVTEARSRTKSKRKSDSPAILHSTARKVALADNPKETVVVDEEVELESSFLFDYNMFETENNRLIKNWYTRYKGLSRKSHFWDADLGRVEVYPFISMEIIKSIEKHRETLEPSEAELLQKEAIVVVNYPMQGVFTAKKLEKICYLDGGRLIPLEKE